jgi:glycosyltransferase involved in cell wall biosynthesis
MPIPILFTIPNFITAGSGRAMLNIVQRLDSKKYAPAVCVLQKGGSLDLEVGRTGIPLIEAPFTVSAKPYSGLIHRARNAAQVFRGYGFQLWHSFHYSDDYTEPVIAHFSGARAWVYTKKNMNWGRRSWYIRTLLANRVAVQNSDMMRDFFSGPFFRGKARPVARGVDTELFHPDVLPKLRLREKYGLSKEQIVVGCVAHLLPVKGHPTLLEAVSRVPNVRLLIAGKHLDEEYSKVLERQVEDLRLKKRVLFLGNITDVPAFLSEINIFVLPTWAKWRMEGCPVALLEAMACGKACIATDIPGSRDLIEHGKSGWIVPPENVHSMAEALSYLAASDDKRRTLGEAASARIVNQFTIEKEVAAHEALYDELLYSANSTKKQ